MLQYFRLDVHFFNEMVNCCRDVNLPHKGRKSYFDTLKDRILLLYLFIVHGNVNLIRLSCKKKIMNNDNIQKAINQNALLFYDALTKSHISFNKEILEGSNGVSCIIDCTVVQCGRPKGDFQSSKQFYSGKYKMYCLKKQVVVNVNTGTACYVSKSSPGSEHDMLLLKRTAQDLNNMIGDTKLIADKGYKGIQRFVPNGYVAENENERKKRVMVERFFGRLKTNYSLMINKFRLNHSIFDTMFDICCAIANIDIMIHPLDAEEINYRNYLNNIIVLFEEKRAEKQRRDKEYRRRQRESLDFAFDCENDNFDNDLLDDDDFQL